MAVRCRGGPPARIVARMGILLHINAALTRTGNPRISELNDGTPAGDIAGANYDQIVKAALTGHPWRFATKTEVLTLLPGDPDPPWTYAYQLPADVLTLRVVEVDGIPILYEQQFNKLLCDWSGDYDVIAKFIWNVPEANWPGTFAEAITQYLEALFLRGIGERYTEAEGREKAARGTMQAAKLEDSRRASARNPVTSPTLAARGGTTVITTLPWR